MCVGTEDTQTKNKTITATETFQTRFRAIFRNKKGTLTSHIKMHFNNHFTYLAKCKTIYLTTKDLPSEKLCWKEDVALMPQMRSMIQVPGHQQYGYFDPRVYRAEDTQRSRVVSVS